MAAVSQKTLNWLYAALASEYQDVNRAYNDVAQALSQYPSLSPKTDMYNEMGTSALLLRLLGTLPVTFRGTVYHFPVSIWVPHAYPREAPHVYVTPTQEIMIRPGQHVNGKGKVYHPYLTGWGSFWDKSNIVDLLSVLRDVFAKEPPVVSQEHQRQPVALPQSTASPPPVPPLPPELGRLPPASPGFRANRSSQATPPPPPPKPQHRQSLEVQTQGSAPPVPPLPGRSSMSHIYSEPETSNGYSHPATFQLPQAPQRLSSLRDGNGRSVGQWVAAAPLPMASDPSGEAYSPRNPVPLQPLPYPRSPSEQHHSFQRPLPGPIYPKQGHDHPRPPMNPAFNQPFVPPPAQSFPAKAEPTAQPAEDLLSTSLSFSTPADASGDAASLPAPPIPPNPEKDALLRAVGLALYQHRQQTRAQTRSTLQSLDAQHAAMLRSAASIQQELEALQTLDATLSSNERILADSLRRADEVMAQAQTTPAPKIEELLVAPTAVGQQLYQTVAEERALGDAMFVLARALDKGRIGLDVFLKQTRSLAREQFLKMALVRKIGRGMGLEQEDQMENIDHHHPHHEGGDESYGSGRGGGG